MSDDERHTRNTVKFREGTEPKTVYPLCSRATMVAGMVDREIDSIRLGFGFFGKVKRKRNSFFCLLATQYMIQRKQEIYGTLSAGKPVRGGREGWLCKFSQTCWIIYQIGSNGKTNRDGSQVGRAKHEVQSLESFFSGTMGMFGVPHRQTTKPRVLGNCPSDG